MNAPPSQTSAGWYAVPGDPTGTVRRWNGSQWVGGPVAGAPTQRKAQSGAKLSLKIVGRPHVVDTDAGIRIQFEILNRGTIDALVSFEVKLKGGASIQIGNPEAIIRAGHGPVKMPLSAPLDSGLTEKTRITSARPPRTTFRWLRDLGFDPREIDGYFGPNTLTAATAEIGANGNIDGPTGLFQEYFPDDGAILQPAFDRLGISCG